jgi:hypothetical protein
MVYEIIRRCEVKTRWRPIPKRAWNGVVIATFSRCVLKTEADSAAHQSFPEHPDEMKSDDFMEGCFCLRLVVYVPHPGDGFGNTLFDVNC